ncbi:MAG: DUF4249 domain-containing protein, partial [Verrucomicrobia bacterium]|nr:DUF4249 domain-containing protein [Cytophagales bacterium]
MRKIIAILVFGIGLLAFYACVEEYNINVPQAEKLLVVDGLITDDTTAYTVTLTETSPFVTQPASTRPVINPVRDAVLTIKDDQGNEEILAESEPGIYTSKGIHKGGLQGVAGRKYHIEIVRNSKKYVSQPEMLKPAQVIDGLFAEFNAINEESRKKGHEVFINTKDAVNQDDYYRWSWTAYYAFTSDCNATPSDAVCNQQYAGLRCLPSCYMKIDERRFTILVDSDDLFNGKTFVKPLGFVPFNSKGKVLFTAQQFSLSQKAYNFWKLVYEQSRLSGSIFDKPPAFIQGNVSNENDKSEIV